MADIAQMSEMTEFKKPELDLTGLHAQSPDFASLYEAHSRYVYYLALRLLGDPSHAEDVVHDVFIKAYRHIHEFRGEAGVRTWLYRITINHCQNFLRRWQHRNVICTEDEAIWNNAPSASDSPLRVLEIKELGQRIQRTLENLPEEYRLLLLLVADEHMSYEEIAHLTEQSIDAVRGKLHRARKAFIQQFSKTA